MYRVWSPTGIVETPEPARFAGIASREKIFGRLTCPSGKRAREENRTFFATYEDAIAAGYRPCKNCKPQPDDQYVRTDAGWRLAELTGSLAELPVSRDLFPDGPPLPKVSRTD